MLVELRQCPTARLDGRRAAKGERKPRRIVRTIFETSHCEKQRCADGGKSPAEDMRMAGGSKKAVGLLDGAFKDNEREGKKVDEVLSHASSWLIRKIRPGSASVLAPLVAEASPRPRLSPM